MTKYTFKKYIEHKYIICLRKFILPSRLFQCNITFLSLPVIPFSVFVHWVKKTQLFAL